MSGLSFSRAISAMWWVFLSVGILIPLLPRWVSEDLHGSGAEIGLTVLIYGVAGVLSRPLAGWYLRAHRPEPLMAGSVVVGVIALAFTPVIAHIAWMWSLRFLDGAAVGLFYTAAATGVIRATAPEHRGSRLAYFSVPLFLGVALGPIVGDWSLRYLGSGGSWLLSGGVMALAVVSVLPGSQLFGFLPMTTDEPRRWDALRAIAHPAALLPAAVLALSIAGWAAFQAFVPLYGPLLGVHATGSIFLTYSGIVLTIRLGAARWFDRSPVIQVIVLGCVANIVGLLVAAFWPHPGALYLAAALMAVSIGCMYTTLMQVALTGVRPGEEGSVVAAYSLSYDVGAGLGAAALGLLLTWTGSYASVFAGGAVAGLAALTLLFARFWPRRQHFAGLRVAATD